MTSNYFEDVQEQPCEVCGAEAGQCECMECPVCNEVGNPKCFRRGGHLDMHLIILKAKADTAPIFPSTEDDERHDNYEVR